MLRPLMRLVLVALGASSFAESPRQDLSTQFLPVYGGGGGTAFTRNCGRGFVLTGVRYRQGATFDAIGVLCRPVLSNGQLGSETTVGTQAGGGGGTSLTMSCAANKVVVGGSIGFATYVGQVEIFCRDWYASNRTFGGGTTSASTDHDLQPFKKWIGEGCESARQPAIGIRGRAGTLLDALGFICNEP